MTIATTTTAPRIEVGRALKDAVFTALISFALLLPLIGFRTVQNMRNELELETRLPLLLAIAAVIPAAPRTAPSRRGCTDHRAEDRVRQLVHPVRDGLRGGLSNHHHGVLSSGRAEVDR
jgi:hypothetical protein